MTGAAGTPAACGAWPPPRRSTGSSGRSRATGAHVMVAAIDWDRYVTDLPEGIGRTLGGLGRRTVARVAPPAERPVLLQRLDGLPAAASERRGARSRRRAGDPGAAASPEPDARPGARAQGPRARFADGRRAAQPPAGEHRARAAHHARLRSPDGGGDRALPGAGGAGARIGRVGSPRGRRTTTAASPTRSAG